MKKKPLIITLAVVLALIFIIGGVVISSYNGLVSKQASVEEAASNIDADLQRRNDLIPNLVSTVKGYAAHEKEVFTAVADARAKLAGAGGDMEKSAAADAQLSSALSRLLMVVERYPELKADKNFSDLQSQLEGTENRIKVSRRDYNAVAKEYNQKIRQFPTNLIAGMFGFDQVKYFEAAESAKQNPTVSFE